MTVVVREGDLVIRRMRDERVEYEQMVRWRNEPHVRQWWDPDEPPLALDTAIDKYAARTRLDSPTTACMIEVSQREVGYIQFYRWASYPEEAREVGIPSADSTWGLDVFIGEPDMVGRGVGSRAVDVLCRYLFSDRGASKVALAAAVDNLRAVRAYEKAGFERRGKVLDTDTRHGERVQCWLMVRQVSEAGL